MIAIPIALTLILASGCGNSDQTSNSRTGSQTETVQSILDSYTADNTEKGTETDTKITSDESKEPDESTKPEEADISSQDASDDTSDDTETAGNLADSDYIDLTSLSKTMVYSEVYNMMYFPEDFVGKTVKMSGIYAMYYDEVSGKYYHACIITDATACCAQGIEFELTDEYSYPDDYPEQGGDICVEGTFDTYYEGEDLYCTLRNAVKK